MRTTALIACVIAAACGARPNPAPPTDGPDSGRALPPGPDATRAEACQRSGCSGQVCVPVGTNVETTCVMRPEYACYEKTRCEPQANGDCGFTQTPELTACLANPPAL